MSLLPLLGSHVSIATIHLNPRDSITPNDDAKTGGRGPWWWRCSDRGSAHQGIPFTDVNPSRAAARHVDARPGRGVHRTGYRPISRPPARADAGRHGQNLSNPRRRGPGTNLKHASSTAAMRIIRPIAPDEPLRFWRRHGGGSIFGAGLVS